MLVTITKATGFFFQHFTSFIYQSLASFWILSICWFHFIFIDLIHSNCYCHGPSYYRTVGHAFWSWSLCVECPFSCLQWPIPRSSLSSLRALTLSPFCLPFYTRSWIQRLASEGPSLSLEYHLLFRLCARVLEKKFEKRVVFFFFFWSQETICSLKDIGMQREKL